jgi:hypothetical protein
MKFLCLQILYHGSTYEITVATIIFGPPVLCVEKEQKSNSLKEKLGMIQEYTKVELQG